MKINFILFLFVLVFGITNAKSPKDLNEVQTKIEALAKKYPAYLDASTVVRGNQRKRRSTGVPTTSPTVAPPPPLAASRKAAPLKAVWGPPAPTITAPPPPVAPPPAVPLVAPSLPDVRNPKFYKEKGKAI